MGLGANEDGRCSGCESDHLRPWGTLCLAYKYAIQKCADLNFDQSEYRQYLDLNLVRRAKDLPENGIVGKGVEGAMGVTGGTPTLPNPPTEDKDDKNLETKSSDSISRT